jgi:membrane fusion protein (multidrug efflux system)
MKEESKNTRFKVYIPLAIVVIIVLAGAWLWYRDYSMYITTDDAHVDADNVSVSAKIMGRIASIYANEGDLIEQGMLMADLDSMDLVAQRNQTTALKAQAQANLVQSETRFKSDNLSLKVLEINLDRAGDDMTRAKKQSEGGVITLEQFDHIKKTLETASAQLDAAKGQVLVSKSMISSASASVEAADAQIKVLDTQLRNTKLYAPADGVVARRWLLAGDVVQPGQSVFTITVSKSLWIVAFMEETKISDIHTGQNVKFTIDAFPDVKFTGKIFLVGSSTASVFSLIPANNASGNFTKVTQRIPVRISIETASNNKDLSSFNILSGMSAVVKIIKK